MPNVRGLKVENGLEVHDVREWKVQKPSVLGIFHSGQLHGLTFIGGSASIGALPNQATCCNRQNQLLPTNEYLGD